jgi:regulator of sigma E protease
LDKPEDMQRDTLKSPVNGKASANGEALTPGSPDKDASADKASASDVPITSREWWIQNGPLLALVLAVLVYLFLNFDAEGLVAIAKAALGLSFVVFLHELGHFLAAKWCDVHVTTFSIGFGPAIPGCSFRRGETTYKLALFPLGGYVQMVGQVDGDEASDGSEDDPRSYRNKTVGQRMLIISAGVIMNVILAIVCFVVVFRGPGKDRMAGVIGTIDTGAPAFKYGLRSGAEILKIGETDNPYFENLMVRVMAALPGEKLEFISKRPDDSRAQDLWIEPRNDSEKGDKKFVIGLVPPDSTQLLPKRYAAGELKSPSRPDSAAAQASPPFEFGDHIIATTDPENPTTIKELRDDPRFPNHGRRDFFELMERFQQLAGKSFIVRVQRANGKDVADITLPPTFYQTLGVRMQMGHITGRRDGSPADKAGILINRKNDSGSLLHGDLIQKVQIQEADGTTTTYDEKNLDPERLPFQLRQWAERQEKAKVAEPWHVTLTVARDKDVGEAAQRLESKTLELTWDNSWRFDRMQPMGLSSPQAIPELGLAYQIKPIVAEVFPDPVQDNPLRVGDAIKEIRTYFLEPKGANTKVPLKEEGEQWARVASFLQMPGIEKVVLKVWRNQQLEDVTVYPAQDKTWPTAENGLVFMQDMRRQKAANTVEAVSLGFSDTWDSMKQVFQNLRGMIIGTISPENLGGPVTIARVAYRVAGMDFWEFVFFLGLISVNLAVINFLPIPVLDGGHMVFLLYEKVRGKPASEGVRIGATYAGLALILCLMVFVLYLDISRLL